MLPDSQIPVTGILAHSVKKSRENYYIVSLYMTLIGPRRKSGAFWKKRPLVKKPRGRKRKTAYGNYGSLKTINMPNVFFTKLKYSREIEQIKVPAEAFLNMGIGASNLAPIGLTSAVIGDFPQSTVGQPLLVDQQQLWTGINGYARWFEKMNILSNRIKVKVWADSTGGASTNANLQVVLCAFSFRAQAITGTDSLATYTTTDLMNQKGAMCRMISGSGGKNYCTLSTNRSTRTMLGMQNVSDNYSTSCGLQQNLLISGSSPLANPNPEAQWYYYLRIYNPNQIQVDCTWSVQMVANVKFTQRTFALPSKATTAAPPV